jgi:hypothetical protein
VFSSGLPVIAPMGMSGAGGASARTAPFSAIANKPVSIKHFIEAVSSFEL